MNTSFDYNFLKVYHGDSKLLGAAANGWTISNITSWQSGGNLQAINSPNFGLALSYNPAFRRGHPVPAGSNTVQQHRISVPMPRCLLCRPRPAIRVRIGGLATNRRCSVLGQRVNGSASCAPAFGTNGLAHVPVPRGAAFFDSDLALYKTFHINDRNSIQFRVSAFNWLNHPLPEFSSGNQFTLKETLDYQNQAAGFQVSPSQSPTFGYLDTKAGAPNQRIWELSLKYMF